MKILLSNYSLGWFGGTQTWVSVMKKELELLGHEVHLFAGDNNYSIFTDYKGLDDNYDMALINHNTCLSALDGINIKKKIFTSHGVIPELEQPIRGADMYISVSEEVQNNLIEQGFASKIIRNPIDLTVFNPERNVNPILKNILFLSNYQGDALNVIEQASKGYNLEVYGKNQQITHSKVLEAMESADIVIALGRTAYEAMALNRNVIVYDYNGADGLINNDNIFDFRKNNCSGRYKRKKLTIDELKALYELYNPHLQLRPYIKQHHDSKKIVQQYLDLWNN